VFVYENLPFYMSVHFFLQNRCSDGISDTPLSLLKSKRM